MSRRKLQERCRVGEVFKKVQRQPAATITNDQVDTVEVEETKETGANVGVGKKVRERGLVFLKCD